MVDTWTNAEEVKSNWFKFDKVGDKVKGTLLSRKLQPSSNPQFPDQWIYELKTEDSVQNVGISVKKAGTVQRLNSCSDGEIVGIAFDSETPSKSKGFAATKNLKVFTFGMDGAYATPSNGVEVTEDVPFM